MSNDPASPKLESKSKRAKTEDKYELIYWPSLPGRAEPIRLSFAESSTPYTESSSVSTYISPTYSPPSSSPPPFAPPILKINDSNLIFQATNILLYLGPKLGLAGDPEDEMARYKVNEIALTAWDLSDEAHNTHHPVGVGLYYDDQKEEAKRNAKQFREERLPKFLGWMERVLEGNGGEWLVGGRVTYADLVVWHVVDGCKFAFPKATKRVMEKTSLLEKHYERVKERPRIKEYLESEKRRKFGDGIFRHYPELDDE